jgi:hypothetical protein
MTGNMAALFVLIALILIAFGVILATTRKEGGE